MRYSLLAFVSLLAGSVVISCGSDSDNKPGADGNGGNSGEAGDGATSGKGGKGGNTGKGGSKTGSSGAGPDVVGDGGAGNVGENGVLWFASKSACGLTSDQLQTSGKVSPAIVITASTLSSLSDLAVDSQGNLWVVGPDSDDVMRLPASEIGSTGTVEPDLVIQSASLSAPGNLAFDSNGALWVANRGSVGEDAEGGSIVRFDLSDDLSGTQKLKPAAVISSHTYDTYSDFFQLGSISVDSANNLWVSSFIGLTRFDDASSVEGTKTLVPDAFIDKLGYETNQYFYSSAFDKEGSMWSASSDGLKFLTSLTKFTEPGTFVDRGSPAAAVTIIGPPDLLPAGGIAFDATGQVWMAGAAQIFMYSGTEDLSGMSDVEPDVVLELVAKNNITTNSHLVFTP